MYPFALKLGITLTISSIAAAASSQPKSTPTTSKGFVARLIYRTSPLSPYYNPDKTIDDFVAENRLISAARKKYRARLRATSTIYVPLTFSSPTVSQDFVMLYNIGTPPVEALGIPDTGSELIWIQCNPCHSCYPQSTPLYNSTNSSTFDIIPCTSSDCHSPYGSCADDNYHCSYRARYVFGPTSEGVFAKETFYLGFAEDEDDVPIAENIIFGCGISNTNPEIPAHSGVIGMGNASMSLVGQIDAPQIFSYCHNRDFSGGLIRFGFAANRLGEGKTPLVPNSFGSYHLILEGINVADEMVNISTEVFKMREDVGKETGFIIDTGTSVTELVPVAFDAVAEKVKLILDKYESTSTGGWEVCYSREVNGPMAIETLPDMTFKFKDLPVRIPQKNLWIWDTKNAYICLAIERFDSAYSILGMMQQGSFNVAYDLESHYLWMSYQGYCPT